MADVPDELTLNVNRDREGRRDVEWAVLETSGQISFIPRRNG